MDQQSGVAFVRRGELLVVVDAMDEPGCRTEHEQVDCIGNTFDHRHLVSDVHGVTPCNRDGCVVQAGIAPAG